MAVEDWPFRDPKNVMALTTKDIIQGTSLILYVSHDEDDGMWQFHDGSDVELDKAMLVSLEEVVSMDNTVKELYDLPLGWVAWRTAKNNGWKRQAEKK